MKDSLTIRNAEVILPQSKKKVDVSVFKGRIDSIGKNIQNIGEVIDAEGLYLIPGIIDPQVHFREPGNTEKDDLHSGSWAAAAGGVTSFLDMPNNDPPITTLERMKDKKVLASEKSVVNYGFFVGATNDNLDVINKVDNDNLHKSNDFYSLGLGEGVKISAYHDMGIYDLMESIHHLFSEKKDDYESIKFSIVGRPNVGKSTIFNAIIGDSKSIVDSTPGTTRDSMIQN